MDGRQISEGCREFDQRLRYEDRHRVEIARERLETDPLGLKRDRATSAERIEDRWWLAVEAAKNFPSSVPQDSVVRRRLPLHKVLDDLKQTLALGLLGLP